MLRAAAALALAVQVTTPASGQSIPMASPQNAQKVSLGDALHHGGEAPLHILYVHGMGQEGAGDSAVLRKKLCEM